MTDPQERTNLATATSFSYATTGGLETGDPGFSMKDGQSKTFPGVAQGTYTVTETVPAAYQLTDVSCDVSGTGTRATPEQMGGVFTGTIDITLSIGGTVDCIYTDTKFGKIIINKVTDPSGDSTSFSFVTTSGPTTALVNPITATDATSFDSGFTLLPGTYTVQETVPTGWKLTALSCSDPSGGTTTTLASGTASIALAAGETVTCT